MSELVSARIADHAARLRLVNLADNLDGLITRAEQHTLGYLEFIDLLLEEEVGVREGRRFRNASKLSGLPHRKTLDRCRCGLRHRGPDGGALVPGRCPPAWWPLAHGWAI
jgi:hypothetical protein